jgi:cytochrome c oxidase subunit 4
LATSAARSATVQLSPAERDKAYPKLGNREIVGFGVNGNPTYADREEFPCPAVRFKENTPDVLALREKEKGDWKNLTLEEKKELYRASFCQTYSEMKAPTGEWKAIVAGILMGLSLTGWLMIFSKQYVYPPLPSTITEEWKEATLDRMVKLRHGPITGYAAKYDYENEKWK